MADVHVQPPVGRRKFATPPVKVACLSCRAARTRCDGGHPCLSCVNKRSECTYRPSRRGGARVRKKEVSGLAPASQDTGSASTAAAAMDQLLPAAAQQPVDVQNYIDPGAALGQLPDMPPDSDFIFDSLFQFGQGVPDVPAPPKSGPLVRTYRSDRALLQAYYCWIHPYVPILPPPESPLPPVDEPAALSQNRPPSDDDDDNNDDNNDDNDNDRFEPSTPVALALSAVLALIPSAHDTDPSSAESIVFRRKCAQFYAQAAIEAIESESDIPESATEPSKALESIPLSSPPPRAGRAQFHPRVPVELESIIALNLLSVYEYAQRGNIKKMQSRAGQALMDAMMTYSLHTQTDDDDDVFAEARRRVWWMTYVCATQSSVVSNTPPPLGLDSATFTTKFPTLDIDPEAWSLFIEAQQSILTATQFVIELNRVRAAQGDMQPVYRKMAELETRLAPLVERAETWTFASSPALPMDQAETCLVRSLRSMARIKLNSARIKVHRYCAFYDVPVFSGRHCDLKSVTEQPRDGQPRDGHEPLPWPACSCSGSSSSSSPNQDGSAKGSSVTPSQPGSPSRTTAKAAFGSHVSAKICLRSALNITAGFDGLPYPNPSGQYGVDISFLSPTSPIVAPRMLPSFVCCAMQGAYVLLSIYHKTKGLPGHSKQSKHTMTASSMAGGNAYLQTMLLQLQRGLLSILAALENYATAFEALRSMRDQIRFSAESLINLDM